VIRDGMLVAIDQPQKLPVAAVVRRQLCGDPAGLLQQSHKCTERVSAS
jgi:hypothetical protein